MLFGEIAPDFKLEPGYLGTMKILKRMGAGTSRRSGRLWLLRLKKFGIFSACLAAAGALAFAGWRDGAFSRAGNVAHQEILAASAALGFRVGEILVLGRDNIPQEDLLSHLDVRQGAPVFGISLEKAQEEILSISWVRSVRVSRRLPDKIIVEIEERVPVALWQHQQKIAAIDAEGKVLTGEALGKYSDLPLVVGEGAAGRVTQIIGFLKAEPEIANLLSSAVRVGGRRWDLHLKNGITIRLPEENVELALRKIAQAAEAGGLLDKDIAAVDLRLPEKLVLEMKKAAGAEAKADI